MKTNNRICKRICKTLLVILSAAPALFSCSSSSPVKPEKQVLDTASASNGAPAWVQDSKTSWIADGGIHRFKSFYSIRGEERISACYSLAKLNVQEDITSEIWADFRALIGHATQGLSESAEDVFHQSRQKETKGVIRGLRFTEAYHQRYLVNGVERIDCFVLSELAESDYRQLRANILNPVVQADPALKKAVQEKHIQLFQDTKPAAQEDSSRDPASEQSSDKAETAPSVPVETKNGSKAPLRTGEILGAGIKLISH